MAPGVGVPVLVITTSGMESGRTLIDAGEGVHEPSLAKTLAEYVVVAPVNPTSTV